MKRKGKVIAVDFDGTCVSHEYPRMGKDIEAIPVLKKLVENGHKLILFTMRTNKELKEAVKWFEDNNIELWGVNENPNQKHWSSSRKVYANLYVDDLGLGIPLAYDTDRPYVNWLEVEKLLISAGYIS